jgi:hypothetical protein
VRELAPFALLVCACGAAVREPLPPVHRPASFPPEAPAASTAPDEPPSTFEALAARGPAIAPGMREASRKVSDGGIVELAKAEGRDACVRVAFEAIAPVTAKVVDGAGRVLAVASSPSASGVLGERGPVCIRRGDVVKGLVDGPPSRVRWMTWEAP